MLQTLPVTKSLVLIILLSYCGLAPATCPTFEDETGRDDGKTLRKVCCSYVNEKFKFSTRYSSSECKVFNTDYKEWNNIVDLGVGSDTKKKCNTYIRTELDEDGTCISLAEIRIRRRVGDLNATTKAFVIKARDEFLPYDFYYVGFFPQALTENLTSEDSIQLRMPMNLHSTDWSFDVRGWPGVTKNPLYKCKTYIRSSGVKKPNCNVSKSTTAITTPITEPTQIDNESISKDGSMMVTIVVALVVFLALIVIGVLVARKLAPPESCWRGRGGGGEKLAREGGGVAVVICSSGDTTSRYTDQANQIASRLKSSGLFQQVVFTGWMSASSGELNMRATIEAIDKCRLAVVFCSPHGAKTYGEFAQRGELSTWRDEFVLAAHRLFRHRRRIDGASRKVMVVVSGDAARDVTHPDFATGGTKTYDYATEADRASLMSKLLRKNATYRSSVRYSCDNATEEC